MIQLKKLLPIGIAILTVWSIAINNVNAQTTKKTCTVDVSKPGAAVAAICRGQQIEEFNHQIEGGLYAQLINNPSFEELTDPILNWNLIKTGTSNASLSTQTSAKQNY